MSRSHAAVLLAALVLAIPATARAQHAKSNAAAHAGHVTDHPAGGSAGVAELIPNLFGPQGLFVESEAVLPNGDTHSAHFNSDFQAQFTQFNIALASQLASLPLPSPASGYTYSFDPALGVFERTTESFGPIFADRAETVGRGKFTFSTLYQRMSFDEIEGLDLGALPAVFTHDGAAPGGRADVVTTMNAISVNVDQFALFATYGLTDRLDVSLALPIVTTEMTVVSDATVQRIGTASNPLVHFYSEELDPVGSRRRFTATDSATGLGDLILRVKGQALHAEGGAGLALGLDSRLPTGDELDMLGSGAWGFRPFAAFSWSGRVVSAHANLAYQWNGDSILAGDVVARVEGDVPDQLQWVFGTDVAIGSRLTLAADVIGRRVIDSPRLIPVTFNALDDLSTFPDIAFENATFNEWSGAFGVKVNAFGRLLLDVNVLVSLDDAGLRDRFTPLIGFEYTF